MVALHRRVFASGVPNYRGLRIPLLSKLIVPRWRSYLSAYHDNIIVDYLEFGWPVGYDYEQFGFPVSQLQSVFTGMTYYFDVVLPMGLRSATMACQRITSGISYVCSQQGFDVLNYLDDFQGVEVPGNAATAFCFLQSLLIELGVEESKSKACPPTTHATCLGVEFETLAMTKSVHPERLIEIQELLRQWSSKTKATKRELQSLLGKLSFVSKCVQNSCIFLMRIIDLLKPNVSQNMIGKSRRVFEASTACTPPK